MTASARLPSWGVSLLVVVGLHAAVLFWALFWHPVATPVELTPAAMLIELEPLAPPPPTPPQVQPPEPQPQPKLIEVAKPKIVLQQPKPKPKPKPQPPKPEVKPQPPAPAVAQQEKSAAPVQAPPQQQRDTGEIDRERALWLNKVHQYLSRHLHYPERERRFAKVGSTQAVLLNFTIDTRGRIVASEIKQSGARDSFNRDIQRQLRKASPVPAPPSKVLSSGTMPINYPINFTITR
ncbi:hypothetical protein A9179_21655 [Pseudomonas alcaligenes]|uniref:Protein TonB n=1 Tax=Aquipseudomonas alcaligenes TaxID=43263 RepID=A0ABR7S6S6_AQUAC|nr:energy transducer TonB [Pseudomonas alcaligenes]MBC9252879.1 hypothetical protein [Pseudomonas alcaligenes]